MATPFDFLNHLVELEEKIKGLEQLSESGGMNMGSEISSLKDKLIGESRRTFVNLTPWQRVQLARHPLRPQASEYIDHVFTDYVPLAGDRAFADDAAIMAGLGRLEGIPCVVLGQQKGRDVHERRRCNFGSPHPEGYRKAMLKMRLAERFNLPVVCFINTPGAFPGVGAEERGQSIAIAENIRDMFLLSTPIVVVVIGEGGSGGALGIGVGDRVLILENSYYSVISPEGCAAILFKDGAQAPAAAAALKITAQDLVRFKIADEVVQEPPGGAHRDAKSTAQAVGSAVARHLRELMQLPQATLLDQRYGKYRAIGSFIEAQQALVTPTNAVA